MTSVAEAKTTSLRRRLQGQVTTGADTAGRLTGFNPAVTRRPDVVVEAASADDVAVTLDWTAQHGQRWSVLGRGHAEIGSQSGGVVITTRHLAGVVVDASTRTARIGAGTSWRDVMQAADRYGLMPVCGSAPDVGVVGLLLGGGAGPAARALGACSDQVLAVQVALPGRGVRVVDADHESDLFGALLGGRPDVGVVTAVDVVLLPQPPLVAGGLYFDSADIPAVVDSYVGWLAGGVPADVTTSLAIIRIPDVPQVPRPLAGRTVAHLRIADTGAPNYRESLLHSVFAAASPVLGSVGALPWNRIGEVHADPVTPRIHVGGGLLLDAFTGDTAAALLDVAGPREMLPVSIVEVRHLGGALATAPAGRPDCVPGRSAAFNLWVSSQPFAVAPTGDSPSQVVATEAVRSVIDAALPWSPGAAALNFSGSANTRTEVDRGWTAAARARIADARERYSQPLPGDARPVEVGPR